MKKARHFPLRGGRRVSTVVELFLTKKQVFFGPRALGGQDVGLKVPTGSRGGPTGSQGLKR